MAVKGCCVLLLLVALALAVDSASIVVSRVSSNQQFASSGNVGERPVFRFQSSVFKSVKGATGGCGCVGYNCGCCETVDFPQLRIHDDTVCVNMTYLSYDIGVSVTISLNYITLYNKTVSMRNPPAICAGVPHFDAADLCVKFSHLDWSNQTFSGCVSVEGELYGMVIAEKDLGCFHIAELRKLIKINNGEIHEESQNMVRNQYKHDKLYPVDSFQNWPRIKLRPVVVFTNMEEDSGDGEVMREDADDDDHDDPFEDLDDLFEDNRVQSLVGSATNFFNGLKKHFDGLFDAISKIF